MFIFPQQATKPLEYTWFDQQLEYVPWNEGICAIWHNDSGLLFVVNSNLCFISHRFRVICDSFQTENDVTPISPIGGFGPQIKWRLWMANTDFSG